MTAEQFKIKKRVLRDIERSYEMTISDIKRYVRQTGTININVVKKFIGFNFFKNTNPVKLWTYEDEGVKNFIISMDMFELHLWLIENYGIDVDIIDDIQDELDHFTTIKINK